MSITGTNISLSVSLSAVFFSRPAFLREINIVTEKYYFVPRLSRIFYLLYSVNWISRNKNVSDYQVCTGPMHSYDLRKVARRMGCAVALRLFRHRGSRKLPERRAVTPFERTRSYRNTIMTISCVDGRSWILRKLLLVYRLRLCKSVRAQLYADVDKNVLHGENQPIKLL